MGGVLQQLAGGSWQPLAFYSKKLSGAGTRHSTFDRELLAAFSAVRHFRFLLEGQQFRLLTDHKPLVTSLFCTTPPWLARQQRQLSFIAEFTSDIRHSPGQENVMAEALSRPPPAATQQPSKAQPTPPAPNCAAFCPEVAEMMNSTTLQITTQAVGDDTCQGPALARDGPSHPSSGTILCGLQ
jgi:hypothetical protein